MIAIIRLERGMSRRRVSSERTDYVPAICTHRPSLLPIGLLTELFGVTPRFLRVVFGVAKSSDISKLEEAKVVTRLL